MQDAHMTRHLYLLLIVLLKGRLMNKNNWLTIVDQISISMY